jgi:hypothetical protein
LSVSEIRALTSTYGFFGFFDFGIGSTSALSRTTRSGGGEGRGGARPVGWCGGQIIAKRQEAEADIEGRYARRREEVVATRRHMPGVKEDVEAVAERCEAREGRGSRKRIFKEQRHNSDGASMYWRPNDCAQVG